MSNSKNTSTGALLPGKKDLSRKPIEINNSKAGEYNQLNINQQELDQAAGLIRERGEMNEELITLLPELRQAEHILVSSIISPNDFSKTELLVSVDNYLNLSTTLESKIKELHKLGMKRYSLEEDLHTVTRTALTRDGADIELIIARSKIEELIANSTGFKSLKTKSDLESFTIDDFIIENGLDDIKLDVEHKCNLGGDLELSLKDLCVEKSVSTVNLLSSKIYEEKAKEINKNDYIFKGGKLDREDISEASLEIYNSYKRRVRTPIINVGAIQESTNSKNITKDIPFRLKLKSSAVLPVYTDSPNNHLMYIVLVDEFNRTINDVPNDYDLVTSMSTYGRSGGDDANLKKIINKASTGLHANKDKSLILSNMLDISERVLIDSLNASVKNSSYKNSTKIENENSLVRIMLYRALENMQTRVMFVPAEYISYIAFDYRNNGTGKSILEDITLLASFKSMLSLSEIYAAINANTPKTDIVVNIDENDPEPLKTKEMIEQMIYNSDRNNLPWGSTSLERHGTWIQNAGMRIIFNHKTMPNTSIEIESKNKDYNYTIDDSTSDKVTTMILKGLGLSPSIIEDAANVEFASVATISNSLTNKTTTERQRKLSTGLSDRHRKLISADGVMLTAFYDLAEANKGELLKAINATIEKDSDKLKKLTPDILAEIAKDMIDMGVLDLPIAENGDVETLDSKFHDYVSNLDRVVETLSKTLKFEDISSELSVSTDTVVNNIKLHLIIRWCEKHGYTNDMITILSLRDKKALKDMINRITAKDDNVIDLILATYKSKTKALDVIAKAKEKIDGSTDDDESTEDDGIDEPSDEGTGDDGFDEPSDEGTGDEDNSDEEESDEFEEPDDMGSEDESDEETSEEVVSNESTEDDGFDEPEDK